METSLMVQDPKKIKILEGLEKKIKRRLLQGKTQEVIPDLRYLITQYRELGLREKADLMEMVFNQFVTESLIPQENEPVELEEPTPYKESDKPKLMSRKDKKESLQFLHRD